MIATRDADNLTKKTRSHLRDESIDFLTPLTGGSVAGTEKLIRCRPVSSQKGLSHGIHLDRQ